MGSPSLWKNPWAELKFISAKPLVSVAVKLNVVVFVELSLGVNEEMNSTHSIVGGLFADETVTLKLVVFEARFPAVSFT